MSYFRFWLACKLIYLGYKIMDKTSFEGIAFTLVLEDWTRKVISKAHYDKSIAEEQEAAKKLVEDRMLAEGEKIVANKVNKYQ